MHNPVLTLSGRQVDLAAPDPATIRLSDIAWSLARIPRFNGHTSRAWSVAEHALLTADILRAEFRNASVDLELAALLHDAHEAYCGDIITPVMWELERRNPAAAETLQEIKRSLDIAIAVAFGIDPALFRHPAIATADKLALSVEAYHAMHPIARTWPNTTAVPMQHIAELRPLQERTAAAAAADFSMHAGSLISRRVSPSPTPTEACPT